jgi:hypothetical protein
MAIVPSGLAVIRQKSKNLWSASPTRVFNE